MPARVYRFPGGGRYATMQPWVAPIHAAIHFIGMRQELVPGRSDVVASQSPYFLIQVYNGITEDESDSFGVEVTGIHCLHGTLNLLVDGAYARGQAFSIHDYSNGMTGLPEELWATTEV
jgi:hypothetical protein